MLPCEARRERVDAPFIRAFFRLRRVDLAEVAPDQAGQDEGVVRPSPGVPVGEQLPDDRVVVAYPVLADDDLGLGQQIEPNADRRVARPGRRTRSRPR